MVNDVLKFLVYVWGVWAIYPTAIYLVQRLYGCDCRTAPKVACEIAKDIIHARASYDISVGQFPYIIKNDIKSLFSEHIQTQWEGMLKIWSCPMELTSKNDGLASYLFICPWDPLNEPIVNDIINSASAVTLKEANMTVTKVLVDYLDWVRPDFKICRIRYARTASEQIAFYREWTRLAKEMYSSGTTNVHDEELDDEINLFEQEDEDDSSD